MRVGIIRKVDRLGRVTIPKEYRSFYHIEKDDRISIIDTPEGILLVNPKYQMIEIESRR